MPWLFFLILSFISYGYLTPSCAEELPRVLVSVPVYRNFIEKISHGKLTVDLMVPVGASAHTFEPTPKQIISASRADLWFTTGEAFEARAVRALQSQNPSLKQIDLRQGLKLIAAGHECRHCHHDAYDLHIWLSPRLAQQQVDTIVKALQEKYPQDSALFAERGNMLKQELQALDEEIRQILGNGSVRRLIVVAHPAYAYFGRDYGIEQLSVEIEGKDPTPRQLTDLMMRTKQSKTRFIVTEPQYSNKGAKLIAQKLGISTLELDPYSEDYFTMMRRSAHVFSEAPILQ